MTPSPSSSTPRGFGFCSGFCAAPEAKLVNRGAVALAPKPVALAKGLAANPPATGLAKLDKGFEANGEGASPGFSSSIDVCFLNGDVELLAASAPNGDVVEPAKAARLEEAKAELDVTCLSGDDGPLGSFFGELIAAKGETDDEFEKGCG